MKSLVLSLVILCSALLPCASLPYSQKSGVINLTKDNFAQEVFGSEHVWLVEFYAPWCGHCKKLAPEWEKLAKNMQGIIRVGAVNAEEERELAGHFQVKGYPTIKLFPSKFQATPDGKGIFKDPIDYTGGRTASALAKFGIEHLPNIVEKVTSKDIDSFLSGDLAKTILFTNKKETTNLYKALAIDFHYTLKVGEVKDSEQELVERFGVSKYPTLVVITPEGEQITYEGGLKHADIFNFLKDYAKPLESQSAKNEAPPPEPEHEVRKEVKTQEEFEKICFNKIKNCLISLLDPDNAEAEEFEKQIAVLEEAQKKQGKFFNFLWINGNKNQKFVEEWRLDTAFPSTVVFNQKKSSIIPYIGAFTPEAITEFGDKILRGFKKAIPVDTIPTLNEEKDEL